MTRDIAGSELKEVVHKLYVVSRFILHFHTSTVLSLLSRIPNSIGGEIEKACRGIYPLQNVNVRKVKVLKKPKFDGEHRRSSSSAADDLRERLGLFSRSFDGNARWKLRWSHRRWQRPTRRTRRWLWTTGANCCLNDDQDRIRKTQSLNAIVSLSEQAKLNNKKNEERKLHLFQVLVLDR